MQDLNENILHQHFRAWGSKVKSLVFGAEGLGLRIWDLA